MSCGSAGRRRQAQTSSDAGVAGWISQSQAEKICPPGDLALLTEGRQLVACVRAPGPLEGPRVDGHRVYPGPRGPNLFIPSHG